MFRSDYKKIIFKVENGLEVIIRGRISIYQKGGIYQLYANEIIPEGIGSLELAFQQLKETLTKEGLFDPMYKKPIPKMPKKIGIITSPTGAVIRDFVKVVQRRYPPADIFIIPTTVQGSEAPPQIINAINIFNEDFPVDVIVIARGGGSLEELWAFNTEEIARAIFASQTPIISAIGHETDFTIADWVADLRAATPSVAGELVVVSMGDLKNRLNKVEEHLHQSISYLLKNYKEQVDGLEKILRISAKNIINKKEQDLANLAGQLQNLSPLNILSRGYSLCQDSKGKTVSTIKQIEVGENVKVILNKGFLSCTVNEKSKLEEKYNDL